VTSDKLVLDYGRLRLKELTVVASEMSLTKLFLWGIVSWWKVAEDVAMRLLLLFNSVGLNIIIFYTCKQTVVTFAR